MREKIARILKANLSCTRKKKVELERCKTFSVCVFSFFFLHLKPISGTQVWVLSHKLGIRNLKLSGKISLKLDSNSSLLLEYNRI